MEITKQELEEQEINPTFQRISILKYLKNNKNHPTAEMIYKDLVDQIPTLSRTTIYNTIKLFRKKGLLNELTITEGEVRYDIDTSGHHHFLCEECGDIIDLDIDCPFGYEDKSEIEGNKVREVHGYFKGICENCREE